MTGTTASSLSLAWNASTDNSGAFYYVIVPVGGWPTWAPQNHSSRTISGLLPQTTQSYNVYAVDHAGNRSPLSNTVTATTLADTTPPAPAPVITVHNVYSARISLTWSASRDDVSFVRYTLFVNGATGVSLLDLRPSTTYSLMVTATDSSGNSTSSGTVVVTTPPITDFLAPTAPTKRAWA